MKWNGKEFKDISVNSDAQGIGLKQVLYDVTHVPISRQKIMGPHGMLKDDTNIAVFKDGTKLTLIGTAEELSQKPDEKVVFLEDLVEEDQKIASGDEISNPGLVNLGNTCMLFSVASPPPLCLYAHCFFRLYEFLSTITSFCKGA